MAKMVILRSQQEKRPHWKLQEETAPLLPLRKSVQSGAKGRGDKISLLDFYGTGKFCPKVT